MAKQLWIPQTCAPETRQEEDDTWVLTETTSLADRSTVTFKAGSKQYALDASVSSTQKTSELFLKRKYR
jgi:hypothetical protein